MNELVRGFRAFGKAVAKGRFATSWWGRAWLQAMEDTALDLKQLKAGRRYAAAGLVGPITVSPGRIAATVEDVDGGPFTTELRLAELSTVDWERFLDRVASRAGHLAALLDRDMPHDLVEAADDAGVHLLPGIGDLDPGCDCPGWELPCRHAAALSFQASWLLDADPFVLLLMRGMSEADVLAELRSRTAPRSPAEGVFSDVPGPLPDLAAFTPAGAPSIPAAPGIPEETFSLLVSGAAELAGAMLAGASWPSRGHDAVRLAALDPAGRLEPDPRAVAAWTYGGRAGLDVLETTWSPPVLVVTRARAALAEEVTFERNHCTIGDVQLRLDRTGHWHPYRLEDGVWWPSGPPETDPATLLD